MGSFDRNNLFVLLLVGALVVAMAGWWSTGGESDEGGFSYENVYDWSEVFPGYEAYLDKDINYSVIQGTSMKPTFSEDDKVLWVEAEPSELNVGDIIIYQHPTKNENKMIVHRIINIQTEDDGYQFETKGDNRSKSDAETAVSAYYVSEGDLRGVVIGVIYSNSLKTPTSANGWKKTNQTKATIMAPASGWAVTESWRV